jgi:hypothetical protein
MVVRGVGAKQGWLCGDGNGRPRTLWLRPELPAWSLRLWSWAAGWPVRLPAFLEPACWWGEFPVRRRGGAFYQLFRRPGNAGLSNTSGGRSSNGARLRAKRVGGLVGGKLGRLVPAPKGIIRRKDPRILVNSPIFRGQVSASGRRSDDRPAQGHPPASRGRARAGLAAHQGHVDNPDRQWDSGHPRCSPRGSVGTSSG